jgi:hypothetical protein
LPPAGALGISLAALLAVPIALVGRTATSASVPRPAEDGGSRALAGTVEDISFEAKKVPRPATVTDTTNAADVIQMTT